MRTAWGCERPPTLAGSSSETSGFALGNTIDFETAATVLNPQLECVYYNAQQNLTFQYAVLLAPLRMTDSEQEVTRKLRVAAAYVDILIARQVWKFQAIDYSTM